MKWIYSLIYNSSMTFQPSFSVFIATLAIMSSSIFSMNIVEQARIRVVLFLYSLGINMSNSYHIIIEIHKKLVDKIYSYKNQHRDVGYNLYVLKST